MARGSDLATVVKPLCDGLAEAYMTTRYPGFDLDDPDWPTLREQMKDVAELLAIVKSAIATARQLKETARAAVCTFRGKEISNPVSSVRLPE